MDGIVGAYSRYGKKKYLLIGLAWNHAYYPVLFSDQGAAMRVMSALEARHIHPRCYFYPSLTRLPYIQGASCPVAEDAAERVLCLPFWPDMDEELARDIAALAPKNSVPWPGPCEKRSPAPVHWGRPEASQPGWAENSGRRRPVFPLPPGCPPPVGAVRPREGRLGVRPQKGAKAGRRVFG